MARNDPHKAGPVEIQKCLRGIDYPAEKQDLIAHARSQHAQEDVLRMLEQIPEREYDSAADVSRSIGEME